MVTRNHEITNNFFKVNGDLQLKLFRKCHTFPKINTKELTILARQYSLNTTTINNNNNDHDSNINKFDLFLCPITTKITSDW